VPVDVPGMTMVPEAKVCVSLSDSAVPPLTVDQLWPAATDSGYGASQIRRGPDADRCAISLPAQPSCETAFPWAALSTGDFLVAAGADREVDGLLDTTLPAGEAGAQGKPASLLYFVLRYDTGGSSSSSVTADWLSDAMTRCAGARPETLGGSHTLVGTGSSQRGAAGPATNVLVTKPDSIVWLSFDGDGWTAAERDRVARIALSRLTA
jgi:hypothetical protein